ncbi:hypothetical protein [Methylobacterium sp. Leaf113]|uniref:hypothetical protein n=1 Tax=Methylobacterium sp. Leaf113 TaxID=1736259 RepID=UPI0012E88F85|nr:hypothetical protein [Methylobacterium sp. Leaf113]
MMSLQLKSEIDPISVIAFIISVLSLIFNVIQWKLNGFRLRASIGGDLILLPDDGLGKIMNLRLANIGGKKFQVTGFSFASRKNVDGTQYMPTNPFPMQPPFAVDVGEEKHVNFYQDRLCEKILKNQMVCNISVSFRKKPITIRVKFPSSSKR